MDENVSVRKAELSDLHAIVRLADQLGYLAAPEKLESRFTSITEDADQTILVVVTDSNTVVGWIHLLSRPLLIGDTMVEIGGLVVERESREKGAGRALLDAAGEWTRSKGYSTLVVRSNTQRVGSHDFFLRLGFKRLKTQHVYTKTLE